jgi:hypothetical protein
MAKTKDTRRFMSPLVRKVVLAGEALHDAKAITFDSQFDNPERRFAPGGMCSCCGASGRVDGEDDWWLVFRAGLVDSDGEYYAMLCGGPDGSGCLAEVRAENARRTPTFRDEAAALVTDLLGDDLDGAQALMEDFGDLGMLDLDE